MQMPSDFKIPAPCRNGALGTIANVWPSDATGAADWIAGQAYKISFKLNWRWDDFAIYHGDFKGLSWIADNTGVLFVFLAQTKWNIHILRRKSGGEWSEFRVDSITPSAEESASRSGQVSLVISIPSQYMPEVYEYAIYIDPLVVYYYYNLGCYIHLENDTSTNKLYGGELCAVQSTTNIQEMPDGYQSGESLKIFQLEPNYADWPIFGNPSLSRIILGYNFYEPFPSFSITGTPPFEAPTTVYLDGTSSMGDGYTGMSNHRYSITSYSWSFGDGGTAVTPQPEHTYQRPGIYSIKLTITTESGASKSLTQNVQILDAVPLIKFDQDYCYFPSEIKPGTIPNMALYIKNEGGATTARIDENLTNIAKQPLISNISVPGYTQPTPYGVSIPSHTIDWYLNAIPIIGKIYTINFHLIRSGEVEVDAIDYSFKIVSETPVNENFDYNNGWQDAGNYINVPGKSEPIYIGTEAQFKIYAEDTIQKCEDGYHFDEETWSCVKDTEGTSSTDILALLDKYKDKILIGGGAALTIIGALLLVPNDKGKK